MTELLPAIRRPPVRTAEADPGSAAATPGELPALPRRADRRRSRASRRRRHLAPLAVVVLLGVQFLGLGLVQAARDSVTWDEGIYMAAGVTALTRHDLRLNPEHPPLAKVLAAAPVLLADPVMPDGEAWATGRTFSFTTDFVRAQDAVGRFDRMLLLSRLLPLLQGVAVGALAGLLAARLFGRAAGLLAAATWYTLPFALGFSHLASIDVTASLVTLATSLALLGVLRSGSAASAGAGLRWRGLVVLGLTAGAGLATRHTGVLMLLVVVAVVVVTAARRGRVVAGLAAAGLVGLVALSVVWVGYRALAPGGSGLPPFETLEVLYPHVPDDAAPVVRAALNALPLPAEYELGVRYLARISVAPAPVFLLGHAWEGASIWYWPGSALVKLGAWTLGLLVAGLLAWRRLPSRALREGVAVLAAPAAPLVLFAMVQPRPLGLRYLLPVIALGVVAAGPLVRATASAVLTRWRRGAAIAVLAVQAATLIGSHPTSMSFTAFPFTAGYRVTTDTNLDWGQDYGRLLAWAGERELISTESGAQGYDVYGHGWTPLVGAEPEELRGWIAVGASQLTAYRFESLSWLRAYCPVEVVGGSMIVWHLDEPADTRPGPTTPAPMCADGGPSRRSD